MSAGVVRSSPADLGSLWGIRKGVFVAGRGFLGGGAAPRGTVFRDFGGACVANVGIGQ